VSKYNAPFLVAVVVHVHEVHALDQGVHLRLLRGRRDRGVCAHGVPGASHNAVERRKGPAPHVVAERDAHHIEAVKLVLDERREHA